jgi:hypothetical protein
MKIYIIGIKYLKKDKFKPWDGGGNPSIVWATTSMKHAFQNWRSQVKPYHSHRFSKVIKLVTR